MFISSLKYWKDDLLLPVINQVSCSYKAKKKKKDLKNAISLFVP